MKSRIAILGILGGLILGAGCDEPHIVPVMPPGVPEQRILPPTAGSPAEALGEGARTGNQGAPSLVSTVISEPTPIGQPKTTPSSLVYETLKEGTGPASKPGDKIKVAYAGRLSSGERFDSSNEFPLQIGIGSVIKGWDEGIPGMKVGEKRRLTIPGTLGYGANGSGNKIPPNATLIFDIDLLAITESAPPPQPKPAPAPAPATKTAPVTPPAGKDAGKTAPK
jgi:hypothetical protein